MKTYVVVLLLTLFTLPGFAQFQIGVKGGMNVNNIHQNYKERSMESDTRLLLAYHVGVIGDYSLSDAFSLQPALIYSRKGFSYDLKKELEGERALEGFDRTYFDYIEVPVHVAYKIQDFQIFAGPYISAGIGGSNKWDYSYKLADTKVTEKDDYKFKPFFKKVGDGDVDEDQGAFSGLDYGLNLGIGFRRGPFMVSTSYSNGFGNLTPNYEGNSGFRDDFKMRNRGGSLSFHYFFGE